jgi:hypothetical protein
MVTHQQSIRLQVLAEDLVQTAVNLRDAKVKQEKANAAFVDYVEGLESEEELDAAS